MDFKTLKQDVRGIEESMRRAGREGGEGGREGGEGGREGGIEEGGKEMVIITTSDNIGLTAYCT